MSSKTARIAEVLAHTTRLQRDAADPRASVWVSANAGTGKTHVLTQRVLRLLLTGTAPERILCLTYTKAAAAEMSTRVFDTLAGWVGLSEAELTATLATLLGTQPATSELALASTLFTRAIETPGGFKVQTIHAFCERLLQRFPLEAGVSPGFEILDDATARALLRGAIDETLDDATADRDAPLGRALTTAIRYAADDQFDTVLGQAIRQRDLLESLVRRSAIDGHSDPFASARDLVGAALGVRPGATAQTVQSEMAGVLDTATLRRLAAALADGSTSDVKLAVDVSTAARAEGSARVAALAAFLLTQEREPRSRLMTVAVKKAHPDLEEKATRAQAKFHALDCEARACDALEATLALYRLADRVLARYTTAKAARAALDFDDLIVKTAGLLSAPDGAAWVLFKLDGGLDHILVDEAQDTAPAQWKVIESIAAEFFADTGAGSKTRTVFAVGDEKQSIYSFQGAAPEMFAATRATFETAAARVGMPWRTTALTLSFRTVEPVLAAVDEVFADPVRTPGLMRTGADPIRHAVKRLGQGGLVEIWPLEVPDDKIEADAWSPLDEATATSPVARLATRIATTIKGWLDTGEQLSSLGRPIRAGDILILVRKRAPLAPAIVAALKALGVPVAGADRIKLLTQIGVQDLITLGDFLTLPEDDLALATILKSPLFGLDDDDLLTLAHRRKGTLWQALLAAAKSDAKFAGPADQLKRWRKDADFLPPFEFLSAVLDGPRGRARLLERLGPEAADGLDELMNLALSYDDSAPPSLAGFLGWLREDDREIKRDMEQGRDEVRVLTVHGSKGLEAPIVFLPDTCSNGSKRSEGLIALAGMPLPSGMSSLAVWPVKGTSNLPALAASKAAIKQRETHEYNRLLYVALTRPRDRLYIAGAQSAKALPADCWYQLVSSALATHTEPVTLADGQTVARLAVPQEAAAETEKHRLASDGTAAPLPPWMTARAPRESQASIPVAPSRLAPYDFDDTGEPVAHPPTVRQAEAARESEADATPPVLASDGTRFLRGSLTHALLQHLPGLPAIAWPKAASAFLDTRGAALAANVRRQIAAETIAVLSDPDFAALFGAASQSEVPLVAELPNPTGKGPALKLTGQLDRLVDTGSEILILDYKTNRAPPTQPVDIPEAYLMQLAAYRLALARIYPGRTVHTALLWTQTPLLMPVPSEMLDAVSSRLWDFGTPALDVVGLAT